MDIPFISKQQMTEMDNLMIKNNITVRQMMELAGYHTARLAQQLTKGNITILASSGNNGGDALCAARHLTNCGYKVNIFLSKEELKDEPLHQLKIIRKLNIPFSTNTKDLPSKLKNTNMIIDGLIGYNLNGNPHGKVAEMINTANDSKKSILSIDIPSGLDAETGNMFTPCIKATATLALSLPKKGCKNNCGKLYVADMGIPKQIFTKLNIPFKPYFKEKSIIKI